MRYEVWGMRYEVWGMRYEVNKHKFILFTPGKRLAKSLMATAYLIYAGFGSLKYTLYV